MADTFVDRLKGQKEAVEKESKDGEALVMSMHLANGETIVISEIGYHNPHLMIFYGEDSQGRDSSILAHVNSVQLVLRVIQIKDDDEKRPIGFMVKS